MKDNSVYWVRFVDKNKIIKEVEVFYEEKAPTFRGMYLALSELRVQQNKPTVEAYESNEFQNKCKFIIDTFEYINGQSSESPLPDFKIKNTPIRKKSITLETFLYYLNDYLVYAKPVSDQMREYKRIYRNIKNKQYDNLGYKFKLTNQQLRNEALHDLSSYIMIDSSPLSHSTTWGSISVVSASSVYNLLDHIFRNLFEIDFIDKDAFDKTLKKYKNNTLP